ncbi:recombinase family protein [Streptomyces sp. NPDC051677]|uniref:recombinase family protein n=1 Tax=Streptomyces sp. NPDC051677 TaxID=3365669 RepID=UPI0037D7C8AF
MTLTHALLGREYLRVSDDRSKQRRSVTEQHDDNVAATAEHDIELAQPYDGDNDRSASKFATKRRADFEQLLADLRSGPTGRESDFGADVLVLWENSRGSRRVSEWAILIELLEDKGVQVFVTVDDRLYNPARPADRKVLQSAAIDSEQEALKTSARTRRTAAAEAAKGRPHGRPPFGFRGEYDAKTGKLVTWSPDETLVPDSKQPSGQIAKCDIPREVFVRLRKGHSLLAISEDFKRRGILNESGTPYTGPHIRSMALRAAYAGKRVHQDQVTEGTWDGLIDEETFYVVQRTLTTPGRAIIRNGKAKHEISRIIKCGVCGDILKAITPEAVGKPRYQCALRSCVKIDKAETDEVVIGAMLAYLASDKVYRDFAASPGDSEKAARLRAEVAAMRAEKDVMEAAEPASLAEARMIARGLERLEADIDRLEEEVRNLTLPAALSDLIQPGVNVWRRWEAAPISSRRSIARLLLTPSVLGEVRVHQIGSGRKVDAMDRIEWWRG